MKNKNSFNDHDAERINCLTNLVQVKFLAGPLKGPAYPKLTYDKIIRIVKSAKPTPTAQGDAAATSAVASTSLLAAAFNASSKGKPIDIEREPEAVLEEKEAKDLFEEFGPLA